MSTVLRYYAEAMRVPQWVKNLLVFIPLITSHKLTDLGLVALALVMFVAFSLAASGTYIVNDFADRKSDRLSARTAKRPFAKGRIRSVPALTLAALLLSAGVVLAWVAISSTAAVVLGAYIAFAGMYSAWLKRVALLDVILLAGLYCIRLIAGGVATGAFVSPWLLAFSMFFFLSLAILKRFVELREFDVAGTSESSFVRGYLPTDAALLHNVGPVSGYLSVLVFALYVDSETARDLYRWPVLLWLLVPLMVYWITHIWLLAGRGALQEDPVLFATRDRVTYLVAAIAGLILFVGTTGISR